MTTMMPLLETVASSLEARAKRVAVRAAMDEIAAYRALAEGAKTGAGEGS